MAFDGFFKVLEQELWRIGGWLEPEGLLGEPSVFCRVVGVQIWPGVQVAVRLRLGSWDWSLGRCCRFYV